jgi:hypothetical protein
VNDSELDDPAYRKRLYTLAYQRASAVLRDRHDDEFKKLVSAFRNNLVAEHQMTGGVDRQPRGGEVVHLEAVDSAGKGTGSCQECEGVYPCLTARRRKYL